MTIIYRYVTGKRHIPVFLSRIFRSDCLIFYGLVILLRIYNLLHSSLFALIQPYFFSSLQKKKRRQIPNILGFSSFIPSFILYSIRGTSRRFCFDVSIYFQCFFCFLLYFYYYDILQPCSMVQEEIL